VTALPKLRIVDSEPLQTQTDALVVGVFRDGIEAPITEQALAAAGYRDLPSGEGFEGEMGQVLVLAAPGAPFGRLVLVGLGSPDRLSDETLRRAAGAATRSLAGDVRRISIGLVAVNPSESVARAVAEGALLGAYRYLEHHSSPDEPKVRDIRVLVPSRLRSSGKRIAELAGLHARAVCLARDLVNRPPKDKVPALLAQAAVEACGRTCDVEVWDEDRLRAEGFGGHIAVGQGSQSPPRMIAIRYRPADPIASIALVGKGITYDTGGLSLKRPWSAMYGMKSDMAGAAAVIAICSVLAELGVRVEVLGVAACAENMPSGGALRPGDVLTARNGTTVEVTNTDAEGRLVLADGLAYASEQDVDAVVDLATLTGHVLYAVGGRAAGLFTQDQDLQRQLEVAAEAAGEALWHLPMWDDLRPYLDSDVADIKNLSTGEGDDRAGATMAALFLREFVRDGLPWAHLDIAGPAMAEQARYHLAKGATGVGVNTLLRWLEATEG